MPEATVPLIFATSFLVALSGAMMPGPLLAIVMGEAARRGFWAGPAIVLGHGIIEFGVVAALAAGLSEIIQVQTISVVIGLVGGGILLAMGVGTIGKSRKAVDPAAEAGKPGSARMTVLSGVLGSMANPYWLIWWISIGTVYLMWALQRGTVGVAAFYSGHVLADLAWYTLVAFLIAAGKKFVGGAVYRWLLGLCGAALIVLGGYFIFSAVKTWLG